MYRIVKREEIAPLTYMMLIDAPIIAKRAKCGQFVILRIDERGERIPLTIAERYPDSGLIKIIFQEVGLTTKRLRCLAEGGEILDLIGPLGNPTKVETYGTVVLVGGGYGAASLEIISREMKEAGNIVVSVVGARSSDFLVQVEEIAANSDELYISTDDGTRGEKGFVVAPLERIIQYRDVDLIISIGPVPMMRAVADITRFYGIRTIVSLNPIMVDGTGMCGSCRVSIGGKTMFACVDGPDFDAHAVDFDLLLNRQKMYLEEEGVAARRQCRCL
jgi:ferredoxin--NADP+ reductase